MRFSHLTDSCLAASIGDGGLSDETFTRMLMAAAPALDRLCQLHENDSLPALRIVEAEDDLAPMRRLAADWRARFRAILVLGTGGGALAARPLCALADAGAVPRLHFLATIDPRAIAAARDAVDWQETGIVIFSDAAARLETLAQALVLLPALEARVGRARMAGHALVVAAPGEAGLRGLAERFGLTVLDHDPAVADRFSAFSAAGLLPALLAGIDGAAARAGAREVLRATVGAGRVEDAQPAIGAAIAIGLLQEAGVAQSVLMAYEDRLADLGRWYRHLWAESLGKDGTGTTPVGARGPADHSSQLQLYLAGPRDKMFTLILPQTAGEGPTIDADLAAAGGAAALGRRPIGDLLDAAARATAEALVRQRRPVRLLRLDRVDPATLGALMMHFTLETIIAADLLGVDALDQPAVEEVRSLTRGYMEGNSA